MAYFTHFHALIVQLHAISDPTAENLCDFVPVPTLIPAALHPALLVHNPAVDDAVADRLADDVLCVFLRIKVELDADVAERDT